MIKKIIFLLTAGFFSSLSAQEQQNQTNHCATDDIHQKMIQSNPEILSKMAQFEETVKNSKLNNKTSDNIYTIPIVVHVMHKGETLGMGSNVSESTIKAKIKSINDGYRKTQNSSGNGVDIGIQFALATIDPSGNPTNGITRFDMTNYTKYMTNGVNATTSTGISDTELKALDFWDSNIYYNIWIISEVDNNNGSGGVQGYAMYAAKHGLTSDGTVIIANAVKDINNYTATHELAHALNVYHTFEGDSNGSACPSTDPTKGDFCADTAPHNRKLVNCLTASNSCSPSNIDLSFVNNFMSYSDDSCRNMFTDDQKTRMITALTTIRKSFLSDNSTNKLIPATAPIANFSPKNRIVINTGDTLTLLDNSTNIPNTFINTTTQNNISFQWTLTNGDVTLTSTEQNPKFTFTQAGQYDIKFTVTNSFGSDSHEMTRMIIVTDPSPMACIPTSTNNGLYGATVYFVGMKNIWHESSFMNNQNSPNSSTPQFIDLTRISNTIVAPGEICNLNVYLNSGKAYPEYFVAYIDYNNDSLFSDDEKVASGNLPADTANTNCTNGNDCLISNTLTIPTTAVKEKLLRMRIIGSRGTNITLDNVNCNSPMDVADIEDHGIYITDDGVLDVAKIDKNQIQTFPNPVKDIFNISNTEKIEKIEIYNIMGQLLMSENFQDTNVKINLSELKIGTYVATIYSENLKSSIKIIKN